MKRVVILSLAAVLSCSSVAAGYVDLEFQKSRGSTYEDSQVGTRPAFGKFVNEEGVLEVILKNEEVFYSVALEIGTPAQEVTVLFDTGSSDLWVSASTNPYCAANGTGTNTYGDTLSSVSASSVAPATTIDGVPISPTMDCSAYGVFDPSKSSSFKANKSDPFYIEYGDLSYAEGYWGYDQLTLDDLDISNLEFAVATVSNSTVGVLGIGLEGLESTYGYQNASNTTYANFPEVLKQNGAIEKNAYSLYLNKLDAESGSILFGGVDHSKYTGPLYTYPLVNIYKDVDQPIEFDVTVQGIGMQTKSECRQETLGSAKFTGLLDSGTTLLYIHEALAAKMADYVNGTMDDYYGLYMFDCPAEDDDTEIVYDFGGFQITTPIQDYILATEDPSVCALGVVPSGFYAILGDVFLSSAYVVYDLENLEVSLAQATYDAGAEDIEEIISTVPGAQMGPGYSNTYTARAKNIATVTSDIFTTTVVCNATSTSSSLTASTSSHVGTSNTSSVASLTSSVVATLTALPVATSGSGSSSNLSTASSDVFAGTSTEGNTIYTTVISGVSSTITTCPVSETTPVVSSSASAGETLIYKTIINGVTSTVTTCVLTTSTAPSSSVTSSTPATSSTSAITYVTVVNGVTTTVTTCPGCELKSAYSSSTALSTSISSFTGSTTISALPSSVTMIQSEAGSPNLKVSKFGLLTTFISVISVLFSMLV